MERHDYDDLLCRHPDDLTPVEEVRTPLGKIYVKRDDLFDIGGARGGKVRSCYKLVAGNPRGAVTYCSRVSPQAAYAAKVCKALGVPLRAHLAAGADTPMTTLAKSDGAELILHRPGYMNNLRRYAIDDAAEHGMAFVPFSMESEVAVAATAAQVANVVRLWPRRAGLPRGVPAKGRIVVVAGGGVTLAGILRGLDNELGPLASDLIPVLGVVIGKDPRAMLDKWAPPDWTSRVCLVSAGTPYHQGVAGEPRLGQIDLDPYYEAKCLPFLTPGDLFWIVGIRPEV